MGGAKAEGAKGEGAKGERLGAELPVGCAGGRGGSGPGRVPRHKALVARRVACIATQGARLAVGTLAHTTRLVWRSWAAADSQAKACCSAGCMAEAEEAADSASVLPQRLMLAAGLSMLGP